MEAVVAVEEVQAVFEDVAEAAVSEEVVVAVDEEADEEVEVAEDSVEPGAGFEKVAFNIIYITIYFFLQMWNCE